MKIGKIAIAVVIGSMVFIAGCSKKEEAPQGMSQSEMPPMSQMSPSASGEAPMMGMPMMKEDPRSIKSVEGEIRDVSGDQIVVFTQKQVSLKFAVDKNSDIKPAGAKLIKGMHVQIDIEQLPQGMRAKGVTVSHTLQR